MNDIQKLHELILNSRRTVFFGGAGVSTESGIPDFRSTGGLYSLRYKYPPEQIISHSFYIDQPEEFFRFYRDKMLAPAAQPNPAHTKLAQMEKAGLLSAVITQNIDGLHQLAGSKNVLELHGSVHRNYCEACGKFYSLEDIMSMPLVPLCECGGRIKPDVVLYEEPLNQNTVQCAVRQIAEAQLLIIGGTSLAVYPAAGLINYFEGSDIVIINASPTSADRRASLLIAGRIGEVLGSIKI